MPHKSPEARAAYRKKYDKRNRPRKTDRQREIRHAEAKPFCGVDGEGGNINGRHEYLLLRAGEFVLETGEPLTTRQCLDFLCKLPAGREYVSYFFTYDVTMILRDLPLPTIMRLLDRAARTDEKGFPSRVSWYEYTFDWLPGKEFRIQKWIKGRGRTDWVVISDVGSFFQTAFVSALEKWEVGSPELRTRIAVSKAKRSGFTEITELTRLYNKKECDLLAEMMTIFRDVVGSIGPHPYHWQGPGNLAAAWLRHHNVPHEQNVPFECMDFCRNAYYGGRFEITAIGPIRRKIYQYDINSAYPAVIRTLPCLVHGEWKHNTGATPRRKIYAARVKFTHIPGRFLGTLPIRSREGNISYPRQGSGIYWSPELLAAKRAGCRYEVQESWEYIPTCKCRPIEWLGDIYELRKRVGKGKKGNAIKLGMNSLYGKFAQSIGHPRWANPVWAGLITATTRGQIIDACAQVPQENVLMIATDGIFTDVPIPTLKCGTELGEWELTEHDDIFIIQPGLYLLPTEPPKTRGVPRVKIVEYARAIRKGWVNRATIQDGIEIPLSRFRAARQAVHENNWKGAGEWYKQRRKINYEWRTKRSSESGHWDRDWIRREDDWPAWRPDIIDDGGQTVYYGKSIGMWERNRSFEDDQPEGADVLV